MASTLLRRQLARAPRLVPSSSSITPSLLARQLSSTPLVNAQPADEPSAGARTLGAKNVFKAHTVEDLQGLPHTDVLTETGTRRDAEMRHFTGTFSQVPQFDILFKARYRQSTLGEIPSPRLS